MLLRFFSENSNGRVKNVYYANCIWYFKPNTTEKMMKKDAKKDKKETK